MDGVRVAEDGSTGEWKGSAALHESDRGYLSGWQASMESDAARAASRSLTPSSVRHDGGGGRRCRAERNAPPLTCRTPDLVML